MPFHHRTRCLFLSSLCLCADHSSGPMEGYIAKTDEFCLGSLSYPDVMTVRAHPTVPCCENCVDV